MSSMQMDSTTSIEQETTEISKINEDMKEKLANKLLKYRKKLENEHKAREIEKATYEKNKQIMESQNKTKELKRITLFRDAEEKLEALLHMV